MNGLPPYAMRDFFFDPNLHQVDWPAMRQRYLPLVAHVRHRADLTYIIGEMIGELNAGHAYVGGGDMPKAERVPMGLLGAQFERHASGAYRVKRILPGQNWDPKYRSPLTEIGVNVKVGDYILAVNGPAGHPGGVGRPGREAGSVAREQRAEDRRFP